MGLDVVRFRMQILFEIRFQRPGLYKLEVLASPVSDPSEDLRNVMNYIIEVKYFVTVCITKVQMVLACPI